MQKKIIGYLRAICSFNQKHSNMTMKNKVRKHQKEFFSLKNPKSHPDVQNTQHKFPHPHKITAYSKFQTLNSCDRLSTLLTPSSRNQFAWTLSNVLLCRKRKRNKIMIRFFVCKNDWNLLRSSFFSFPFHCKIFFRTLRKIKQWVIIAFLFCIVLVKFRNWDLFI